MVDVDLLNADICEGYGETKRASPEALREGCESGAVCNNHQTLQAEDEGKNLVTTNKEIKVHKRFTQLLADSGSSSSCPTELCEGLKQISNRRGLSDAHVRGLCARSNANMNNVTPKTMTSDWRPSKKHRVCPKGIPHINHLLRRDFCEQESQLQGHRVRLVPWPPLLEWSACTHIPAC